jgi:hypothetical protein
LFASALTPKIISTFFIIGRQKRGKGGETGVSPLNLSKTPFLPVLPFFLRAAFKIAIKKGKMIAPPFYLFYQFFETPMEKCQVFFLAISRRRGKIREYRKLQKK